MDQEEASLPLDGNAAAGLSRELFALDMTAAEVTCGRCGVVAMVGEMRSLRWGYGSNISLRSLRQRCHPIGPYAGRNLARYAGFSPSLRPIGAVRKARNWPEADRAEDADKVGF